ncbi:MAG: hypothetical protein Q9223_007797 [Gallowayella weberi]
MSLKRKRSIDTFSPSSSTTSSLSPSSRNTSPIAFPHTSRPYSHEVDASSPTDRLSMPLYPNHTSSNLHSRTKKRLRNNRPDDSEVFASTYDLLFSAARSAHLNPRPSSALHHQQLHHTAPQAPRQSSLHHFWTLPAPPTSNAIEAEALPPPNQFSGEKCEDCDAPLPLSLMDDVAMGDIGIDSGSTWLDEDRRCRECGRMVCATCAVVEVGAGRECLECRMR